MKNFFKLFGIIALVAIIGFAMAACGEDPEDEKGNYLSDATYIFYPLIRATKGGVAQDEYLQKIEVVGEYTKVYINNNPNGGKGRTGSDWSSYLARNSIVLLDTESNKEYKPDESSYTNSFASIEGYVLLIFKNVNKGTKFKLSEAYGSGAESVFANIDLLGSNVKAPVNKPALPDGTTTFDPPLVVNKNGAEWEQAGVGGGSCNMYSVAVSSSGRYMNISLGVSPSFGYQNWSPAGNWFSASGEVSSYNLKLVDLDNPWVVYEPIEVPVFGSGSPVRQVITFENVKATRFSMTAYSSDGEFSFPEVNIGN